VLAILLAPAPAGARAGPRLAVPVVQQEAQRCGPAALEMVMRFYGAPEAALAAARTAYSPVLKGSLITDLAGAARTAGYDARIGRIEADSLIGLLNAGIPPIVLFQNGTGPVTRPHYGVVTAWDAGRGVFTLNDGTAKPRTMDRAELERRWKPAGGRVLVVEKRAP
jgi:ABC-type bacteriocin/lantibiotic exporter with double-glycine peptidase domain